MTAEIYESTSSQCYKMRQSATPLFPTFADKNEHRTVGAPRWWALPRWHGLGSGTGTDRTVAAPTAGKAKMENKAWRT